MKKLTLITLLAVPALLLAAPIAQAGNGYCCGEGRNGPYRPYWDIYRVAVRTAVSDQPYYGAGTDVILRAGSVVRARCFYNDGRRWCKIKSESIARAYVPRRCLVRLGDNGYYPSWYRYRRHYEYERYENYQRYERGLYFNGGSNGNGHYNGNGNGHYNGNGNGNGYNGAHYFNGDGNGHYENGNGNGYGHGRRIRSDGLSGYPWTDYPSARDNGYPETNGYRD